MSPETSLPNSSEADCTEDPYRALMAEALDLVCEIDLGGCFKFVGENAAAVIGHDARDLLGTEPLALVHPDDKALASSALQSVRQKGACYCGPFRFRSGDNQWRWMEISAKATPSDSVATVWRNVSDRVEAEREAADLEAALHESERRARAVFDQTYQFTGLMDAQGTLIEANETALRFGGISREDVIGKAIWDAHWFTGTTENHARLREAVTAASRGEFVRFEMNIQGAGDATTTIDFSIRPLRNADGEIDLLLPEGRDISDLKQAEEAIRTERDFIATILETAEVIVLLLDPDGRIERVNRHLEEVTGYCADEIVGDDVFSRFSPAEDRGRNEAAFRRTLTEPLRPFSNTLLTKNGAARFVQWSATPLRDRAGRVTGILSVGRDITDQKVLEEQLLQSQKMEAVGTLAGGVAHDFNNLLTAIRGSADLLLKKEGIEGTAIRSAERILKAAARGEALTKQLLAFSRKQVTRPEVLDLNSAIRDAAELFERMIGEDIAIEWALSGKSGAIEFDPAQFDQVVINLAVNARDAMPNGGRLLISTAREEVDRDRARTLGLTPGDYLWLSLQDSGSGISAEALPRIFDPFFTTKEPGRGTGLGLSTVLGIVKQQQGTIRVESEEGRGTTFTVYFPAREAATTLPHGTQAPGAAGSRTILLVEDDPLLRDLIIDVLEEAGYRVVATGDPRAALELGPKHEGVIDLVITDVVMPEMNGFALAKDIASHNPNAAVLLMSGHTDQILADRGQLSEEDAFIRKPFTNDELLTMVRDLLARS